MLGTLLRVQAGDLALQELKTLQSVPAGDFASQNKAVDGTTVVHEGMIKPTPTCGVPPPRPASSGIAQHPAARAAEGPPSLVSRRTADTASQPMDQALGHNIIAKVNGCENKEMHAVAAHNPPAMPSLLTRPMPPSHARINKN